MKVTMEIDTTNFRPMANKYRGTLWALWINIPVPEPYQFGDCSTGLHWKTGYTIPSYAWFIEPGEVPYQLYGETPIHDRLHN